MSRNLSLRAIEKDIVGEAMTSREVYDFLLELCDRFDGRFAGSAAEREAGLFIHRRWREMGMSVVRREPFRIRAWRRGPARLEVLEPVRRTLDCLALPNTPPTPRGGITGPFVSVGDGTPEEFAAAGDSLRGALVMATSNSPPHQKRWIHRMEKYGRAAQAGARAFIFCNHLEGLLAATGSLNHSARRRVPGVGVARETGAYLERLAERGKVLLRLTVGGRTRMTTTYNIVGEIPGAERPEEMVVVGGHYDGHDISQGAGDNASGVAVITEVARLLLPHAGALRRTVRFVAFAAEEVGLLGSAAYVADHADELSRIRIMLNIDGAAGPGPFGISLERWPRLGALLGRLAKEMHYPLRVAQEICLYSDNFAFFLAGVPTGLLISSAERGRGRGFGHTAADTADKPPLRNLQEAASVLARVVLRLANLEDWPIRRRRSPAEVRRLLKADHLLETLRWEERDPFAGKGAQLRGDW